MMVAKVQKNSQKHGIIMIIIFPTKLLRVITKFWNLKRALSFLIILSVSPRNGIFYVYIIFRLTIIIWTFKIVLKKLKRKNIIIKI